MKRKKIIIVTVVLITLMTMLSISKNNKKYIMQDGMMLAMTITDEDGTRNITEFPERGEYNIEIDCGDTAKGIWLAEEWMLGVESITGKVKCNIAFTTKPATLKSKVESVNTTNNNGYRFSGKQPDNWVWFNNEKWRIIGSIPTTLVDGTETRLVKIIRNDSIGGLAFNSTNSNAIWGTNTLYTLLNTKYYGKLNATGASPCLGYSSNGYALCDYTNIGISSESTDYYGSMVKDVYWNVGTVSSTSTVISTAYTTEAGTKSSITGKIGLMSVSDYGYATSEITYSSISLSSLSSYEQNNWIGGKYEGERTLTPSSASNVYAVDGGTVQTFYGGIYGSGVVRPVVYLDSAVYIVSGDGSEGNPYQLAM